jgi:hypothetical protein
MGVEKRTACGGPRRFQVRVLGLGRRARSPLGCPTRALHVRMTSSKDVNQLAHTIRVPHGGGGWRTRLNDEREGANTMEAGGRESGGGSSGPAVRGVDVGS